MAEINEAYATLRDATKRSEYDAWLAVRRDRRRNDHLIVSQSDVALGGAGMPIGPPKAASSISAVTAAGRWARSGGGILSFLSG